MLQNLYVSMPLRCRPWLPYTLSPFTLSPSLCPVTLSPGHFVPGHFVPGHFVPWSLCPLVTLSPGRFVPCHFVPWSFCPPVILSPVTLSPVTLSPIFDFWNDMIWRSIYVKAISEPIKTGLNIILKTRQPISAWNSVTFAHSWVYEWCTLCEN
jgi:hypothetical protein